MTPTEKPFENNVGKGENATLHKTNFIYSFAFIFSSAYAFNLDQSKILSFGKELTDQGSDEL